MKINLDQHLLDARGAPMPDGEPIYKRTEKGDLVFDEATGTPVVLKEAPQFTLAAALFRALNATFKGDDGMPQDKQRRLYLLTKKVAPGGEVDLSAEEIVLLKERVAQAFHFLIVGRCHDLLDPLPDAPQQN